MSTDTAKLIAQARKPYEPGDLATPNLLAALADALEAAEADCRATRDRAWRTFKRLQAAEAQRDRWERLYEAGLERENNAYAAERHALRWTLANLRTLLTEAEPPDKQG